MKVLVKDLMPNPYRRIDKYPISKDKVNALKTSIQNTEFWDNILARKKDGKIEIAYGHHRLEALKELNIQEVDIPVKDIIDSNMIKIMANENMESWAATPSVLLETVLVAKNYIEGEIKKHDSLDHAQDFLNMIFETNSQFINCKKNGVGEIIIHRFLGGNWSKYYIRNALNIINSDNADVISKSGITGISDAQVISDKIKDLKIKKEDKEKIIKKVEEKLEAPIYKDIEVKSDSKKRRQKISAAVEEAANELDYKSTMDNFNKLFPKKKKEQEPDLNDAAQGIYNRLLDVNINIEEVLKHWDYIDTEIKAGIYKQVKNLFESIKNHNGGTKWNLLK